MEHNKCINYKAQIKLSPKEYLSKINTGTKKKDISTICPLQYKQMSVCFHLQEKQMTKLFNKINPDSKPV